MCPAAIKGYLARLYRHQMGRVRLITGRLGTDPALLEPTPIPILQAAQLLEVPPAACAVVASTPDGIRTARQAWRPRHRLRPDRRRRGPAHRRRRVPTPAPPV